MPKDMKRKLLMGPRKFDEHMEKLDGRAYARCEDDTE